MKNDIQWCTRHIIMWYIVQHLLGDRSDLCSHSSTSGKMYDTTVRQDRCMHQHLPRVVHCVLNDSIAVHVQTRFGRIACALAISTSRCETKYSNIHIIYLRKMKEVQVWCQNNGINKSLPPIIHHQHVDSRLRKHPHRILQSEPHVASIAVKINDSRDLTGVLMHDQPGVYMLPIQSLHHAIFTSEFGGYFVFPFLGRPPSSRVFVGVGRKSGGIGHIQEAILIQIEHEASE